MAGDLYDRDILTWSERQADLLRRVAAGQAPNEMPDWENIIEEIESVGRCDLHAVESWLMQAFLHDLKADAWPQSPNVPHWRAEARLFRRQMRRRFTESMRQRIDIAELYRDALAGLPDTLDGQPALPVPRVCTMLLHQILQRED